MAAKAQSTGWGRAFYYVGVIIVGLPVIYFLGVGPAVIISVKAPKLRSPVHAIYYPMIWLHDHTVLRTSMDNYLRYWEDAARRM